MATALLCHFCDTTAMQGKADDGYRIETRPDLRAFRKWSRSGSNRRPPGCKPGALPAELRPRGRGGDSSLCRGAAKIVGSPSGR